MGFRLIPVGHRGDVVFQRQITVFRFPSQRLNGHLQVSFKADRVGNVPSVQAETLARKVDHVGRQHLRQPRVRAAERLIEMVFHVLKVVRAAEIVFRAGAADGGEGLVAVEIELDFAFAPPVGAVRFPGQVRAHVLAAAADAVQDRVDLLGRQLMHTAELRMQIRHVGGHLRERIVDLVVEGDGLVVEILDGDLRLLAERHVPVTVETAGGIDAYRQRIDLAELFPATREEVAHGRFDRGLRFAVPVETQDQQACLVDGGRHPNLLNRAGALDLGERERRLSLDVDRGRDLPGLAQLAGGPFAGAFRGHAGLALFAGEILGANGSRLGVRQPRKASQVHFQTIEALHRGRALCPHKRTTQQASNKRAQTGSEPHCLPSSSINNRM